MVGSVFWFGFTPVVTECDGDEASGAGFKGEAGRQIK